MSATRIEDERRHVDLSRELISLWTGLFKAVRLYEQANDSVESQCSRIREVALALMNDSGELELTVRRDSIFVGRLRIKQGAMGSTAYPRLIALLCTAGISSVILDEDVENWEIELFARISIATADARSEPAEMKNQLERRGVQHLTVQIGQMDEPLAEELTADQLARRIYLNSIGVVKGVFQELKTSNRLSARRVKRVVMEMVDSLDRDPGFLMSLTQLKNYDEYTFNHSVNVSVLSIALGRHLQLQRNELSIVGQAGMFHDLGKLCVPKEVLNKPGRLTPEERLIIQSHSAEGFVEIAAKLGASHETIEVALAAFEHHANHDGSGYPRAALTREKGLLSEIVSIVDRYDAMTSARVYRSNPIPPQKALAIMYHSQAAQFDATLLRYFMNLMGYYPLGTTVRLADNSVAVVVGGSAEPELRHFPKVQLVLDPDGRPASGHTIDLAATAKDDEPLAVMETLDALDYGIEAMDYIL